MPKTIPADETQGGMLGRGLKLLTILGRHPEGVGLTELARESAIPLSTTHRLLSAMVPMGFVRSDGETRQYSLGLAVFELSQHVAQARSISEVARPAMRQLSAECGETTLLSILAGREIFYVERVEGPRRVSVRGAVGERAPVHCTAMGKSLVAFLPDDERDTVLDQLTFDAYTERTLTTRDELLADLEATRDRGFAIVDREYEPDIRAIAMPIVDGRGLPRASLCIAAPSSRVSQAQLRAFAKPLRLAVAELGLQLAGAASN